MKQDSAFLHLIQGNNDPTKGLPWCLNCVGFHPDHIPTVEEAALKAHSPQKDAHRQHYKMDKLKLSLYRNKSCRLCGRSYDEHGDLDETWHITAQRVAIVFRENGYFLDEKQNELVVAKCRKRVEFLIRNRPALAAEANRRKMKIGELWDQFTFYGSLCMILDAADDARGTKVGKETQFNFSNLSGNLKL